MPLILVGTKSINAIAVCLLFRVIELHLQVEFSYDDKEFCEIYKRIVREVLPWIEMPEGRNLM